MGNFFSAAVKAVAGVFANKTRRIEIDNTTVLIAENIPRNEIENAVKCYVEDDFLMKTILSAISTYHYNNNMHDDYLRAFGFNLKGTSKDLNDMSSCTWQESCINEITYGSANSRGASFGIALIRANNHTTYDLYVAQSSAIIRLNFWQQLVDTTEKSQRDLVLLSERVVENVKYILEQEFMRRINS